VHCHTSFPIGHYTKTEIIRKKKKLKKKAIGDNVVEVIFIMPKNIKRVFITKPMKIISIGQHMHSFPHTNIKTCTIIEKPTKKNLPIGMT
jgi:hypothetical protein